MTEGRTGNVHLHGLDALRALAIVLVLFCHYQLDLYSSPEWMVKGFKYGHIGVDLFFVLSGFLIASQLLKELSRTGGVDFAAFYIKRSFRILPPFLFILFLYFNFPSLREREALASLYRYLFFIQNFGLEETTRTFSHAWSLCVEEQFYVVLPALLVGLGLAGGAKNLWLPCVLILITGLIVRQLCWSQFVSASYQENPYLYAKHIYYPTYTRLDGLTIGVLFAWAYHYKASVRDWVARQHRFCLALGLTLVVLPYFSYSAADRHLHAVLGLPAIAAGFGLILMAALNPRSTLYRLDWMPLRWLATFSYAIYLSHKIVWRATQDLTSSGGFATESLGLMLLCFTNCVGFAFLIYALIERPSLSFRQRLLVRLQLRETAKARTVAPGQVERNG